MSASVASRVKKYPLLAFYILAFGITWLVWVPQAAYSRGLFPFDSPLFYIIGGVGSLLAAFIVHHAVTGSSDYVALFRPLWQWRAGAVWYAVALFGYAALWLIALGLRGELAEGLAAQPTLPALLVAFLTALVAAIPEEVGWRGFALPRLQARYSALVSSLIVGVLWALWHLPLLLNLNSPMTTYPLLPYLLTVVAVSVTYTWLFNSTRGSLFFVTLYHAASNVAGRFAGVEQTLVFAALAVLLIVVFGPARLASRGQPAAEGERPSLARAG